MFAFFFKLARVLMDFKYNRKIDLNGTKPKKIALIFFKCIGSNLKIYKSSNKL